MHEYASLTPEGVDMIQKQESELKAKTENDVYLIAYKKTTTV